MRARTWRLREAVMPDWLRETMPEWLAEVVRPKRATVPWPDMLRSALAICVPLSVSIAVGRRDIGSLVAMGGLLGTVNDAAGPYPARVRLVATAGVAGGAGGLAIGSLIHGRGWVAVVALIAVAGASAVLSRAGATGSATGLQLLTYTTVCLGPLGELRPWWHAAIGFVAGVAWALLLIVPGWLLSPRGAERRAVAAVYHDLAAYLRVLGTPRAAQVRDAAVAGMNEAYDMVLSARSAAGGRTRPLLRLTAALNASHQMVEGTVTLRVEGNRPPPAIADAIDGFAAAIAGDGPVPAVPPLWTDSPGSRTLRDSMVALSMVLSGSWTARPARRQPLRARVGEAGSRALDLARGGRVSWTFAIRLMSCVGVAAWLSEVLPLQRSYWVVLTTAIVLKPDYGSVFARALQRGIGTVVGAVLGAVLLALVPYGSWLLVPFGLLAALLPYGRSRSFGLTATFLTPLVVLLIDLLAPGGWRLAGDRLIDTVLGCAVVLLVGYAPWPASWHAHLPSQFASTVRAICRYMEEALITAVPPARSWPAPGASPGQRSRLRRQATRGLSDLRAEFQRTLSEPVSVRRLATAWWPGEVGLEEVVDAVTAVAVSMSQGAPAPAPETVRQLTSALLTVADAIAGGTASPVIGPLPDDEPLKPVTAAVNSVLNVLCPRARPHPAQAPF